MVGSLTFPVGTRTVFHRCSPFFSICFLLLSPTTSMCGSSFILLRLPHSRGLLSVCRYYCVIVLVLHSWGLPSLIGLNTCHPYSIQFQFSLFPAHINMSYNNNNVFILCRKRGGRKTMTMNVRPLTITSTLRA